MGDDSFFRTRMGQRFFESTVPRIADELARLNRNLEALVTLEQRGEGSLPDADGAPMPKEVQPSAETPSRSR